MTRFGYTLMTEQSGPRQLVDHAVAAERAGFDFEVSSDHYTPWLTSQGRHPGNLAIYRGSLFPMWNGDLLLPNMSRPASLVRMVLAPDGHVVAQERMLEDLGQRLRDVRVGPEGAVYLLTDETAGAVLKITPAS